MPRELRKRGKKTKKVIDKDEWKPPRDDQRPQEDNQQVVDNNEESSAGPSWIIKATADSEEINPEAPFGYIDADVKAYFRTVDIQIRNWQENEAAPAASNEDVDPNEGTCQ